MDKITRKLVNGVPTYSGFNSWPNIFGMDFKKLKDAANSEFYNNLFLLANRFLQTYLAHGYDTFNQLGIKNDIVDTFVESLVSCDIFEILKKNKVNITPRDISVSFENKRDEHHHLPRISLLVSANDLRSIFGNKKTINEHIADIKKTMPAVKNDNTKFIFHIYTDQLLRLYNSLNVIYSKIAEAEVKGLRFAVEEAKPATPQPKFDLGSMNTNMSNFYAQTSVVSASKLFELNLKLAGDTINQFRDMIASERGTSVIYSKELLEKVSDNPEYAMELQDFLNEHLKEKNKPAVVNVEKPTAEVTAIIPTTKADAVIQPQEKAKLPDIDFRNGYFEEQLEFDAPLKGLKYLAKSPVIINVDKEKGEVEIKYSSLAFTKNELKVKGIKNPLKVLKDNNLDNIKSENFHTDIFARVDAFNIASFLENYTKGDFSVNIGHKPEFNRRDTHALKINTKDERILNIFSAIAEKNSAKITELFGETDINSQKHDVRFAGGKVILNSVESDLYYSYYRPLMQEIARLGDSEVKFKETKEGKNFKVEVSYSNPSIIQSIRDAVAADTKHELALA